MNKNLLFFLFLLGFQLAQADAIRAVRHPDVKKACEQSPSAVVAVLLHGSDWCGAGEELKSRVWDQASFAALLPDNVILTSSDLLEHPLASQADQIRVALEKESPISFRMTPPEGEKGSHFTKQANGYWLITQGGANPNQEILTQKLYFPAPVSLLRLTVPPRQEKDKRGPGNSKDGKFFITEIELSVKGTQRLITACAPHSARYHSAITVCDGDLNAKNGWEVDKMDQEQSLYLFPIGEPLPANTEVTLTIREISRWPKFTLASYRLDAFTHRPWMPNSSILAESVNALPIFYRPSTLAYPSLNCFDAKGRCIGRVDALPYNMSAKELSGKIRSIIQIRDKWETLCKNAESAASQDQKIRFLAKAYSLMKKQGFPDQKALLTQILKLDPQKESPWTWSVAPDMPMIRKTIAGFISKKEEQNALNFVDKMLQDPRLSQITPSLRQEIILEKFNIYRRWKEHSEERFIPLREIVSIDPTTFLGIGAQGYLDFHNKGDGPSIAFGWAPKDLQVGKHSMIIKKGVPFNFYQPGLYQVSFSGIRSKEPVEIRQVSLLSDGKVISKDIHTEKFTQQKKPNFIYRLELKEGYQPESLSLAVVFVVPDGHECSGHISVSLYLPEDGPFGWKGETVKE